jgi:hypothetical protein
VDDRQLRSALKRKVLASHAADPGTRVIDELGLHHGASRVDVAVVNGLLHGFEIKSDRDTLARLPSQMQIYNSVLDRVTLVAGVRHESPALRLLPDWWGVKIAQVGPRGGVQFHTLRAAAANPLIQPLAVARLLWRHEALSLLEFLGEARGFGTKPRAAVHAQVAEVAPLDLLRSHVRNCLKQRTAYRFG